MFSGMIAFPLTPFDRDRPDEAAYQGLISRLTAAGADAICTLGSTGSYMYLSRAERARMVALSVEAAGATPVMAGIGALTTREVLHAAEDAQRAGAASLLLAPVSYQRLTADEVYGLYEQVCREISVPLCVYDNPGTTHFEFSDELHYALAALPGVGAIKLPGGYPDAHSFSQRISHLQSSLPASVVPGVSGDAFAADGLIAGCAAWYSVIGGLFPEVALLLTRLALRGEHQAARDLSTRLAPLWSLFSQYGSLRVVATAAGMLGLTAADCLPSPLRSLDAAGRDALQRVLNDPALQPLLR